MKRRTGNDQTLGKGFAALLLRALCVLLIWSVAGCAHAASIYKCVDADGSPTFRDTPCATHTRETKLDVTGQPLIDPDAPRHVATMRASKSRARSRSRHASSTARKRKAKQPTSWECRAADGEVFYRHTRCPGSVPGDGVVRSGYAERFSFSRSRKHHDAWSRVPVHGKKIPRTEACRRIHSAGAAGRDGHQRDASVSTYDHLMGRDPCSDT